jgi:hypothetical protein
LLFLKYCLWFSYEIASIMMLNYSSVKLLLPMWIYFNEFGTWRYMLIFLTLIGPIKLAYRSRYSKFVLKVKSLNNLAPALSSIEFNLRFRCSKVVFSFIACEIYREPSYPIELLARFKCVSILFFNKNLAILREP